MKDEAERIAAGLIKGEREAIMALPQTGEWWPRNTRHHLGPDYPRDALFFMWANKSALVEGRGRTTGFPQDRLTPLGLAVRRVLQNQEPSNAK